jgi:hypothetical protein
MSQRERDDYLKRMYFDTSKLGSYGGLKRFYNAVKEDGKFQFTKREVENGFITRTRIVCKSQYVTSLNTLVLSRPGSIVCDEFISVFTIR